MQCKNLAFDFIGGHSPASPSEVTKNPTSKNQDFGITLGVEDNSHVAGKSGDLGSILPKRHIYQLVNSPESSQILRHIAALQKAGYPIIQLIHKSRKCLTANVTSFFLQMLLQCKGSTLLSE